MGMTATERLRALLDERGVEWWEGWDKDLTLFDGADGIRWIADYMLGELFLRSVLSITPEQAIAATLGRGECTDTGRYCFTCSECGWAANEPHHALGGFWPTYCPNCGRKVVDE